jgi:hypothetical protein
MKKITLLPMTPTEIVQCDRAITETAKHESETQQHTTSTHSSSNAIKLKRCAKIATKSEFAAPPTVDAPFHVLVCRQALFSLENVTTPLPRAITNLLQEFKDVFPAAIPPGLSPLRGIECQINLILGASLPNRVAYRTNLEETKEIQRQV